MTVDIPTRNEGEGLLQFDQLLNRLYFDGLFIEFHISYLKIEEVLVGNNVHTYRWKKYKLDTIIKRRTQ